MVSQLTEYKCKYKFSVWFADILVKAGESWKNHRKIKTKEISVKRALIYNMNQ